VTAPDVPRRAEGRLSGCAVAILVESDYVEPELSYYRLRFAEENARVDLLTRLWGQPSITFTGHEYRAPLAVDGDLEALDDEALARFLVGAWQGAVLRAKVSRDARPLDDFFSALDSLTT
jgi:hypothetical protein